MNKLNTAAREGDYEVSGSGVEEVGDSGSDTPTMNEDASQCQPIEKRQQTKLEISQPLLRQGP